MRQQLLFCLVILVTPSAALALKERFCMIIKLHKAAKQIADLSHPCNADCMAREATRYAICHCKQRCLKNVLQKHTLPRSSIQCP